MKYVLSLYADFNQETKLYDSLTSNTFISIYLNTHKKYIFKKITLPKVFSLEASDVRVDRRASDLNFFSGI